MLEAFIITLREGVEAALIVGITLAYLAKIGRNDLRKSVYAALAAAFVGSIGVAVLVARLNLNQDIVEGWVMLASAFFVVTMIVFMMRATRGPSFSVSANAFTRSGSALKAAHALSRCAMSSKASM